MGNELELIALVFMIIFAMLGSGISQVEANHTTKGATFWYNVCKSIDKLIVEPCGTLTSNHDPYNQGLSTEGWKVAKCVGGGALALYAGRPELLSLGPIIGCKSNSLIDDLIGGLSK